jgi:predicted nucleotidyltransferase component of viral defense system
MIGKGVLGKIISRLHSEHGGTRIPDTTLERDYCLAWFLVGLAQSPLREQLAFKGGTLLRRCYFEDYRFSEDLDFTLLDPSLALPNLLTGFSGIFQYVEKVAALTDKPRNEPRDLYDLHYLLETATPPITLEDVRPEIVEKLKFKGRRTKGLLEVLGKKEARLKGDWKTRLQKQVQNLPEVESIYRAVYRAFRQANFDEE